MKVLDRNKWLLGALTVFSATIFVTACENNNGGGGPAVENETTLREQWLSDESLFDGETVIIKENIDNPQAKLVKKFFFQTDDVVEVRIRRGTLNASVCQGSNKITQKFYLLDQNNQLTDVNNNGSIEPLAPGSYQLVVEMKNPGLCKRVDSKFSLKTEIRDDLVVTRNSDVTYECRQVSENNKNLSQSRVLIQSNPIQVTKYDVSDRSSRIDAIVADRILCGKSVRRQAECSERLIPTDIDDYVAVAKKRVCTEKDDITKNLGQVTLKMTEDFGRMTGELECRNLKRNYNLKVSNCVELSNFGEKLSVNADKTTIEIAPGEITVNLDIAKPTHSRNRRHRDHDDFFERRHQDHRGRNHHDRRDSFFQKNYFFGDDRSYYGRSNYYLDDHRPFASERSYMMIFFKDEYGLDRPLLTRDQILYLSDLEQGPIVIREQGIVRRINKLHIRGEDLKIVLSQRPQPFHSDNQPWRGYANLSIKDVCDKNSRAVQLKDTTGIQKRFCR